MSGLPALLGALLCLQSAAEDEDPRDGAQDGSAAPPRSENIRVREVPFVTLTAGGSSTEGFLLPTGGEEPLLLLSSDGRWVSEGREEAELSALGNRPLSEVPSVALVIGLGFKPRRLADCCEEWLRDQRADALDALLGGVGHADAEVRTRCWRVLFRTKATAKGLVSVCRTSLRDGDERVRKYALGCLVAQPGVDACDAAESCLAFDRSPLVQHEALMRLGEAGDLRAMDALLEFLAEPRERALERIGYRALRNLTSQRFGHDLQAWSAWWENRRERLLEESEASR